MILGQSNTGLDFFHQGWEANFIHSEQVKICLNGLSIEDRFMAIRQISDVHIRTEVARAIFGQKTADDIGLVSTMDHPKTDYGEPRMGSGWDLDMK